ncbi:MAG: hypothetical protein NTY01_00305 [Verrucomicrobia bacterium]|nr:hypothetical protein [Verrucomicrobiota bacterium]
MKFACPHCGQHIEADEEAAGITIECPNAGCRLSIIVPGPIAYAVPASPPLIVSPPTAPSPRAAPKAHAAAPSVSPAYKEIWIAAAAVITTVGLPIIVATMLLMRAEVGTIAKIIGPEAFEKALHGEKISLDLAPSITVTSAQSTIKDLNSMQKFASFGLLIGGIWFLTAMQKSWAFTIRWFKRANQKPSMPSQNIALWPLFIPVFNFYWCFRFFNLGKDLNRLIDIYHLDAPRCNRIYGRMAASAFLLVALGPVVHVVIKMVGVQTAGGSHLPSAYDLAVRGVSALEVCSMIISTAFLMISIQSFASNLSRSINSIGKSLN